MDSGAQDCSQHGFFPVGAGRLPVVRPSGQGQPVPSCRLPFCNWFDGKVADNHAALRLPPMGFLAVAANVPGAGTIAGSQAPAASRKTLPVVVKGEDRVPAGRRRCRHVDIYSEGGTRPGRWPPLSHRLSNAIFSYARYLALTFWPSNMVPLYPNRGASLTILPVAGSLLLLIGITALVLVGRRHRYLPIGWFWFLGTLVPTLQVLQFGLEGMADRFAYQAVIGLFIIVCWGVSDWVANRHLSRKWLVASGVLVLLALAVVTRHQIGFWKTPNRMWAHALATVPGHWFAERQVGQELALAGKSDEAMQHFRRVLQMAPDDGMSNLSVGIYDQQHGNPQQAIAEYKTALKAYTLEPKDTANIYHNMGVAYRDLGDSAKAQECFDKAVEWRNKPREDDAD